MLTCVRLELGGFGRLGSLLLGLKAGLSIGVWKPVSACVSLSLLAIVDQACWGWTGHIPPVQ